MLYRKLKHYYVTGVLIEPGSYVDRHGNRVVFQPTDNFAVSDVVPIYYEHDGPIVGFATRFYTTNNKLCFDGYVFDPTVMQVLMSENPGVSAELIRTSDGYIITGLALTKHPAIENARIQGVIAMSSLKTELQKFLEDNGIENAENIAALVEKFLAQFKYPSPELKQYEVKLSEAAKTIEDLTNQLEELKATNEKLLQQINELKKEIDELQRQLEQKNKDYDDLNRRYKDLENRYRRREYERRVRELENEIRRRLPNADFSDLPEDLELRIKMLEKLLDLLNKIKLSQSQVQCDEKQEKLEFSASASADTNTDTNTNETVDVDLSTWESAINMYINVNDNNNNK